MTRSIFTLDCAAFGVPFRLCADTEELLAKIRQCIPFGSAICTAPHEIAKEFVLKCSGHGASYCLLVEEEVVVEGADLPAILKRLASDLMVHVANQASDRVFVHAGVVGWQGRAMILPGRSFAGKTTLVAELVRAGATYYSDEYAVFDERGYVHPYARDLQMREIGAEQQRSLTVAELKGSVGNEALPVAQVVIAEYMDGARWVPQPISPGLAALEMMRNAIPIQRTPARVMATLAKVMEAARALKGIRGEASETVPMLLDAMMECGASV